MAAAGWDALDRPEGELYRGARLGATLEWLERGNEPLADTERDFVEASRAVADDQVRRLAEEASRHRQQNRRLRALVAAATVLLVVAVGAGLVARDQGLAAERGRDSVRAAAATARHQSLVTLALSLLHTNRAVAAMLAVLAWRQEPDAPREVGIAGDSRRRSQTSSAITTSRWATPRAVAAVPRDDRSCWLSALRGSREPGHGRGLGLVRTDRHLQLASEPAPGELGRHARRAAGRTAGRGCPPACGALLVYDLETRRTSSTHRRPLPRDRCGHQPGRHSGDRDRRAR